MAKDKLIYASAARKAILDADPRLAYCIDEIPGVDVPKWISVKDRMPESHVEPIDDIDGVHYIVISDFVLGYTDKGDMVVVQHEVGDERDWWLDYGGSYHTITHWMLLPKPPKGDDNG